MKAPKVKRHPLSVSATDLAKLGHCELMIALDLKDSASIEMDQASKAGEAEHERFHLRAVLNAGTPDLVAKIGT